MLFRIFKNIHRKIKQRIFRVTKTKGDNKPEKFDLTYKRILNNLPISMGHKRKRLGRVRRIIFRWLRFVLYLIMSNKILILTS